MSKNLIFCFDGTSNDPADARQEVGFGGSVPDESITNVLKLHLLFGGDLVDGQRFEAQRSFYYSGVGTYGNRVRRIVNALFSPEHRDVATILRAAVKDVDQHYKPGDRVFVFGFSRGAALARRFAAIVRKKSRFDDLNVQFLGAFDTVASIGKPNLDEDDKPVSDVVFEDRKISPAIKQALHLVALDERRKAFMPTLMNAEERVTEVWLPGAHSDIGGGYRQDGLSDIALQFMLDEIERRGLGLAVLRDDEVAYGELEPEDADYRIMPDDVLIQPNPQGINHQQERARIATRITLGARDVRVIRNDRTSRDDVPVVHWAASERIQLEDAYRPESLRGVKHEILLPTNERIEYAGLREHSFAVPLRQLDVGETMVLRCFANLMHNRTKLFVSEHHEYVFEVDRSQTWKDASIVCGPNGWTRDDVQLGFKEIFIRWKEDDRRHPDAAWFELLASVDDEDRDIVRVLDHTADQSPMRPARDGELYLFTNDLPSKYDNNAGVMLATIRRVR
ncbi:MAG: DUF2235 domain-containing protein [bacterium]|nr:DUF2235 domain-containing protein [bacterium]